MFKVTNAVVLLCLAGVGSGCASSPPASPPASEPAAAPARFDLRADTTQLEGWFSSGGSELTLYPLARISDYERYDRQEDEKCVPLLNATGRDRSSFGKLEGRKVVVKGRVIAYADLSLGSTNHDEILQKRYFNGQVVMNYCYRKLLFIAEEIAPAE